MIKFVAFLRGINVGGKNMIKMETLRQMFSELGFNNVKSYINSGNIIFESDETDNGRLSEKIAKKIVETFSFDIRVITRKMHEIEEIVANNPFAGQFENDKDVHVFFLDEEMPDEKREILLSNNNENERYFVRHREVFCHLRTSVLDSLMGKDFIAKKLKMASTARNWRTINKILEM